MSRIKSGEPDTADPATATAALLGSVRKSMRAAPNLLATMAHSPAQRGGVHRALRVSRPHRTGDEGGAKRLAA